MRDDLKAAGKFITDVVTDGMVVYPFFTVLAVIAIPILLLGRLIYLILAGWASYYGIADSLSVWSRENHKRNQSQKQ